MVNSIDPTTERFLAGLADINRRLERAQNQVASGLRLAQPSDDPDQVSNLLELRMRLEQTATTRSNLGRLQAEADTAEQGLQSAIERVDRALVLGAEGASTTQTAESRRSIAEEVRAVIEQIAGLSRSEVEGRFVFSGDSDQQAPYELDMTQTYPVSAYLGTPATRQAVDSSGTLFRVSKTAEEIFDDAADNASVFRSLSDLRAGLENNDPAAIRTAIAALRRSSDHLNTQLAFYGSVQNRIELAAESASKMETRLKGEIGDIESADITSAILELNQMRFQQEAALSSKARLPRTSLFDYLA